MQISDIGQRKKVLQSQLLLRQDGVEHFSSTKGTECADEGVWMPKQVHGTNIVEVRRDDVVTDGKHWPKATEIQADAVITNIDGEWIGVHTADCVPVLLYDPVKRVVAAVHAGWRGTVKHIVALTIRAMRERFGCVANDLYAVVGPSISPERFEVGQEVADEFAAAGRAECIIGQYRKPHIDLWQSNVMDMLEEGMDIGQIDCTPLCTMAEADLLYSARREGIGTGRIVTAIRLTPAHGTPAEASQPRA